MLFPADKYFKDLPSCPPSTQSHKDSVEYALESNHGNSNIVVDCQASASRPVSAVGAAPCVTPTHPMYSVSLGRYLEGPDYLQCQGLWPCTLTPTTWNEIAADTAFARDLAGNSFSSTVNQAMLICSLACCTDGWEAVAGGKAGDVLRRLRRKRAAPEYDNQAVKSSPRRTYKKKGRTYTRSSRAGRYKRKVPGEDSRKNNQGKSVGASIWDKEHLPGT